MKSHIYHKIYCQRGLILYFVSMIVYNNDIRFLDYADFVRNIERMKNYETG